MNKLLEKAVAKLVIKHAFINSILLSTEVEEKDDLPFPAATDGNKIMVCMPKIMELCGNNDKEAVEYASFIMAHEVYHIALLHPFRRGNRDAMCMDSTGQTVTVWNLACDASINEMLAIEMGPT